jgi:hypothetical protein
MRKSLSPLSVYRTMAILTAGILCAVGIGCAGQSGQPELTLHSAAQNRTFSEQFAHAYVTQDVNGDTDVVMLDRAAEGALQGVSDGVPVRQVMHIRVLWNARSDMASEHMSASNAAIHWYVMGNTAASAGDVLEYAGTAFIVVDQKANQTELQIRNASMRPVACRGGLCDPIGSITFQGTIRATENPQRVREALACVRTAVALATAPPTEHASRGKLESSSLGMP